MSENVTSSPTSSQGPSHRLPHFVIRNAAPSYSNLSAVLAGFAFAAVVLVLQQSRANALRSHTLILQIDWATVTFLVACFGCVISALLFAVVAGEEEIVPRTNMSALFAASAFAISGSLVFWGLLQLMEPRIDASIAGYLPILFNLFAILLPNYLTTIAVDNYYMFPEILTREHSRPDKQRDDKQQPHRPQPTFRDQLIINVPAYLVILAAIGWKIYWLATGHTGLLFSFPPGFIWLMGGALVVILASSVMTLAVSNAAPSFHLRSLWCAVWILFPTLMLAFLMITA